MDKLIDAVIAQIRVDLENDEAPLIELLKFVPKENLIQYLSEEEWAKYEDKT